MAVSPFKEAIEAVVEAGGKALKECYQCGLGKCARCNVGDKYICKDGPVFTLEQISTLLEQF